MKITSYSDPRELKACVVEAASAAYYDSMIGQVPHTDGWAGKPEAFKEKVRERMRLAIIAGVMAARKDASA